MGYILYLDASGDSGQYRGKNTKHFVLGGLSCKPETSFDCAPKLDELVELYFPDPNVRPKKLHYSSLINNKYPWNKIDKKQFADDFFEMILSADITLFSMVINKEEHWRKYVHPIDPYSLTLEMMMGRYQGFLERREDIGMVVSDRESKNLMEALLRLFERFKEKGTEFRKLNNIFDTIFFAPSYTCPMLQAIDFCAYAVFSHYERKKSDRFNQIFPKFNKYGLYKLPK